MAGQSASQPASQVRQYYWFFKSGQVTDFETDESSCNISDTIAICGLMVGAEYCMSVAVNGQTKR